MLAESGGGGAGPSFGQLCAQLRAVCGAGDFVVKYTNDEGDVVTVTVTCDAKLAKAVMVAGDSGMLHIDVLKSDQSMDADAAPFSALPATPSASTLSW